ncbi:MutS-like protein [Glugoides intestinalis]
MEETFNTFYKTLDHTKFKYFIKGDSYYVYNTDIKYLPLELKAKNTERKSNFVKLQSVEAIIRELLLVKKVAVEEYKDYLLLKRGFPGDVCDFLDICVNESISPTIFAVVLLKNGNVDVSFIRDSKIQHCEFNDDDLLSNLFSLCSTYNCVEILYSNQELERIFNSWGISSILIKCNKSVEMIRKYMKIEFEVLEFTKENCCLVNISDFDLVDFNLETQQGKRLLNQWLRSPSIDQKEIEKRLDISECFCKIPIKIHGFGDLKKVISKIHNRSITPQETVKLSQTIARVGSLICAFQEHKNFFTQNRFILISEGFLKPLENLKILFSPLIMEIENTLDSQTNQVHSHLSEELTTLQSSKFEILSEVEREFLQVKKDYPKVTFSNKLFKISRFEYNQSDFNTKKYVVSSILKTGVLFLTKRLSDLNENIKSIEVSISKAESKIFCVLVNTLTNFTASFEAFNYLISLIDIYKAFSLKVENKTYCRPKFCDNSYEALGIFHPVLEHKDCITNDVNFTQNTCVLTGPNMGGKSTFIKSLSMISLYAQIGCYVPAKSATIPIFDRIFLRIGAKDCSSQKLSTFMVEMTDLNKIIRTATPRSLILIDELGRGTSAIDGLSLALSVRDYLINLGAKTVMATHFSELGNTNTMNKKMLVDGNLLMYKVVDGVCDLSFGINVAEMARFPSSVISSAKSYLLN